MGDISVDYGVMVYSDEENDFINVGDYIQSIACCSFLSPNVFINREKLDVYSGNPTKMIMNGWYIIHPEHWPPSKFIEPLFVAFHMEKSCKESMLSPEGSSVPDVTARTASGMIRSSAQSPPPITFPALTEAIRTLPSFGK